MSVKLSNRHSIVAQRFVAAALAVAALIFFFVSANRPSPQPDRAVEQPTADQSLTNQPPEGPAVGTHDTPPVPKSDQVDGRSQTRRAVGEANDRAIDDNGDGSAEASAAAADASAAADAASISAEDALRDANQAVKEAEAAARK